VSARQDVLVLLTGGTIGSGRSRDSGAVPSAEAAEVLREAVREHFGARGSRPRVVSPWGEAGLDSSDLDPGHWVEMTRILAEEIRSGGRGILILHGTDTMAYSAAWLSLCFAGAPASIVLTGSQFTRDYAPEDGTVNLRGAAQVVASGFPGVWLYFNWKLIPGARAHKARATHPDAFVAQNGFPVYFNPEWGLPGEPGALPVGPSPEGREWREGDSLRAVLGRSPEEARSICGAVAWRLALPGADLPLTGEERILGLLGFGSGNLPQRHHRALREAYGGRKPILLACSQAEGDIKNPGAYRNVGMGGLAEEGFPVYGQMDWPLEFVHALACFALLARPEDPEAILSRHLKRFR